jgi:hypothetical protein
MKKVGGVVLSLCLLFVVVGCGSSPKEKLEDSGLFGEHSLARIESFGAVQGSVSGSFFLGFGSVNGSIGSEFKIQFYWSPKPGEIVATALPYSKFRFFVDEAFVDEEAKDTPTVEFVFNDSWLNQRTYEDYSEKRHPNLNDFVLSDNLEMARVRISSTALEREVYLPQIR